MVSNQGLSLNIAKCKVNEVINTGAQTVVTSCPSCVMAITMAKTEEKAQFDVLDITQLVCKAAVKEGIEKPTPAERRAEPTPIVYQLGMIEYSKAYHLQKELQRKRFDGEIADTILLLEHPPVITIGKSGKLENVLVSQSQLAKEGVSLFFVDRGGDVTYHGPGQLVAYPIIDLRERGRDVHKYVHDLEEVVIRTLNDFYIKSNRDLTHRGIWVKDEEIAAIGVSIKRWTSMHGFALNVNPELRHFSLINPCSFSNRKATSMSNLLSQDVPMEVVRERLIARFSEVFDTRMELGSDILVMSYL